MTVLPTMKRGRQVLLGKDLDEKVQLYIKKSREGGGVISARTTVAAAHGIMLKVNQSLLAEFGGPVLLSNSWARSLMKQMNFVQRKATTANSKQSDADFIAQKKCFLEDAGM